MPKVYLKRSGLLVLVVSAVLCHCTASFVQAQNRSQLGEQIFDKVQPAVFQVKTATRADAPKASYGTGFVVKREGVLITNYHVVSDALHEPKKYKIFVVSGENNWEAQVLGISIRYDLAVIQVGHTFDSALTLQQSTPSTGERIFSLGIPEDLNLSIIEGVYNGEVNDGTYEHIHMSAPLNSGMSGGPTVSGRGEVIGINVSSLYLSQDISFAVPVKFASQLLNETAQTTVNLSDKVVLHHEIGTQLTKIQQSLASNWKPSENGAEPLRLGHWLMRKPEAFLKCWSTKDSDPKEHYESTWHYCFLNAAAYLRGGMYSGSYEVNYVMLENKGLLEWQLYYLLDHNYNSGSELRSDWISEYSNDEELYTKYDCWDGMVNNSNDIPLMVNYCLRGYVRYPELYDLDVKMLALSTSSEHLQMRAKLSGFTLENIQHFLDQHIQAIHREE